MMVKRPHLVLILTKDRKVNNSMMRKILTMTAALGFMMSCAANICYAEESGFGDVTEAVSYYEDIQRLNDMGVISGYDDGNFYPDNGISVAEGITLAEKVFGGAYTLPERWDSWFEPECGWMDNIHIDRYLFRGDFSKNMSYETAAEVVLKLSELKTIDGALWDMRSTSYNAFINSLYIRGYEGKHKTVPYSAGAITRGEFCHVIAYILDYDGSYTIPPVREVDIQISVYMPEQLTDSNAYVLGAKSAMLSVPENIQTSFNNDGYEVIIVPYNEWFKLFPNSGRYTGFYYHYDKKIYIRSDYVNSVRHELGHYLHTKLQETGYDISTDDSFKQQLNLFRNDKYHMKNDSEFFAVAFDLYCTVPDRLYKDAPEVYEYIDSAVKAFEQ